MIENDTTNHKHDKQTDQRTKTWTITGHPLTIHKSGSGWKINDKYKTWEAKVNSKSICTWGQQEMNFVIIVFTIRCPNLKEFNYVLTKCFLKWMWPSSVWIFARLNVSVCLWRVNKQRLSKQHFTLSLCWEGRLEKILGVIVQIVWKLLAKKQAVFLFRDNSFCISV